MTAAEVRARLVNALGLDLIGPGPDDPQAAEILDRPPSRWYLTGFLVPWNAPANQKVDDDDDQGELDATAGRRGDEEQDAQEQPARRGYLNRCTQDSSPIWLLAPSTGVFRKGVAACRPNDEQRARIVAREPAS